MIVGHALPSSACISQLVSLFLPHHGTSCGCVSTSPLPPAEKIIPPPTTRPESKYDSLPGNRFCLPRGAAPAALISWWCQRRAQARTRSRTLFSQVRGSLACDAMPSPADVAMRGFRPAHLCLSCTAQGLDVLNQLVLQHWSAINWPSMPPEVCEWKI